MSGVNRSPRPLSSNTKKIGGGSSDFITGSANRSSLDKGTKKVGQFPTSRSKSGCENLRVACFICELLHVVYRAMRCNSRFEFDCPYCAHKWRKKMIKEYSEKISRMEYPVMVTLTLRKGGKHVLTDLNGYTHRCRKYLRRKGYNIRAFVSCLDPPNHIHCIWDCSYIPYKKISKTWKTITKDSFITDIRKVDKQRWYECVYYISKYITKISSTGCDVDLRGVHVVTSWGGRVTRKRYRMKCRRCGSYFELVLFCGEVGDYENDPVDFVEIDNDYG